MAIIVEHRRESSVFLLVCDYPTCNNNTGAETLRDLLTGDHGFVIEERPDLPQKTVATCPFHGTWQYVAPDDPNYPP